MNKLLKQKRAKSLKRIRVAQGRECQHELLLLKSGRYIYVQLIDLKAKKTLTTISSLSMKDDIKKQKMSLKSVQSGEFLGKKMADFCIDNKITSMPAFNRACYKFHGIVSAVKNGFDSVFVK